MVGLPTDVQGYLPTDYSNFIHLSKYSRWREELGRRETWEETVDRYIGFFKEHILSGYELDSNEKKFNIWMDKSRDAILKLKVVPSMRALKSAGEALRKHQVAGYNCSFLAIDHPHAFDEILYLSCCGTGVGFSVEEKHISKLPEIQSELYPTDTVIGVGDSKIGWASALRELITLLYAGKIPQWNVEKVRPYGAILKTFGGRASGPEPLVDMFNFVVSTFKKAVGRKLTSLECHDIVCKIGLIAESGGTRRAALISLSDLEDNIMRYAKSGNWWEQNPQRAYANNSAVYYKKPEVGKFIEEWMSIYRSNSGERGIINFSGLKFNNDRRDWSKVAGVNPCSEILLRSNSFCNLSEVIVREEDDYNSLSEKIQIASFLGTLQSTLTKFKYLRKIWQKNCEEERLLGVSLTGIMDNPFLVGCPVETLLDLKDVAIKANEEWAEILGISPAAAVTTIKPSGNVSQLSNSSSGIHPRYSLYYKRTVRMDKKDPLSQLMIDQGFPHEDCVLKPQNTLIFSFPIKSPPNAIFRDDFDCIMQLDLWKKFKTGWAEHNISNTIYVKENEWLKVASWVYENFEIIGGLSFLPYDGGSYKQAPYQEVNEEEYNKLLSEMPKEVDWSQIVKYEKDDRTKQNKELSCTSSSCELH